MKINEELLTLSREHQLSLVLANRAINTARSNNKLNIDNLCQYIANNFIIFFQTHFKTEENVIFTPLMALDKKYTSICQQLISEHQQLFDLSNILPQKPKLLLEFGQLLQSHTRTEDRELFPCVCYLSAKQHQRIKNISQTHPKLKITLPFIY